MKKTLQRLGMVTVGLSLCLWSCKEQDDILKQDDNNNFVLTLDEAKIICEIKNSNPSARIGSNKKILSAKSKKDKNGEDIYHIITYSDNKGFKVVSANKKAFPLLVESESGQFDTTVTGVAIWMHGLEGYIEKQKAKNLSKSEDKYSEL